MKVWQKVWHVTVLLLMVSASPARAAIEPKPGFEDRQKLCWGYALHTDAKSKTSTTTQCMVRPPGYLAQFPTCKRLKRGGQRCSGQLTTHGQGPYLYCLATKEACETARQKAMTRANKRKK